MRVSSDIFSLLWRLSAWPASLSPARFSSFFSAAMTDSSMRTIPPPAIIVRTSASALEAPVPFSTMTFLTIFF